MNLQKWPLAADERGRGDVPALTVIFMPRQTAEIVLRIGGYETSRD